MDSVHQPASVSTSRSWRAALTLVVLAPLIGEVLSGATRISFLFAFVPEMMVWGCGALIIRELVRRWGGGWTSILLLGLGLSIAEEFIIQQTSLAPLPWPATGANYGRLGGVNWIYFLFMLGYESVWVALVPIQITELIFADRRNQRWLGTRGLITSAVIFVLGSFIAWAAWIKRARPIVFHAPNYTPPMTTILAGLLAIALLALAAYKASSIPLTPVTSRTPPSPWIVAPAALVMGLPWYWLMALIFGSRSSLPFWIPIIMALTWAALVYLIVRYWTSSTQWQDIHRWALAFGATLVCMIAGFSGSSQWPRIDLIGKAILNVLAVIGLLVLAGRLRRRTASALQVSHLT
jgi:hypothetical protein